MWHLKKMPFLGIYGAQNMIFFFFRKGNALPKNLIPIFWKSVKNSAHSNFRKSFCQTIGIIDSGTSKLNKLVYHTHLNIGSKNVISHCSKDQCCKTCFVRKQQGQYDKFQSETSVTPSHGFLSPTSIMSVRVRLPWKPHRPWYFSASLFCTHPQTHTHT